MARPDIYAYSNFRQYLNDMYSYLKKNERGFSYRRFAEAAGLGSHTVLKRVMSGERNLTMKSIRSFARGLRLNPQDEAFFEDLVWMNQSADPAQRETYYRKLISRQRYREARTLEKESYDFYSAWYMVPIWEMIEASDFREDPEWIASALIPPIKPQEAAYALEIIERLGLAQRGDDGRLKKSSPTLTTGDEVKSIFVRNFQRSMIRRASEAVDRFPRSDRHASSVTAAVTAEQAETLLNYMHQVRREIIEFLSNKGRATHGSEAQTVVMEVTLQAFPIIETTGKYRRVNGQVDNHNSEKYQEHRNESE